MLRRQVYTGFLVGESPDHAFWVHNQDMLLHDAAQTKNFVHPLWL